MRFVEHNTSHTTGIEDRRERVCVSKNGESSRWRRTAAVEEEGRGRTSKKVVEIELSWYV